MICSRHSIYPCMSLFVPMEQQVNSKSGGNNSCSRWGKYMSKTREETLYTLPFQLPMGFKCQLPQEICQSWFALYFLLYLSQNQKCLPTQAVLVEFSFYLIGCSTNFVISLLHFCYGALIKTQHFWHFCLSVCEIHYTDI